MWFRNGCRKIELTWNILERHIFKDQQRFDPPILPMMYQKCQLLGMFFKLPYFSSNDCRRKVAWTIHSISFQVARAMVSFNFPTIQVQTKLPFERCSYPRACPWLLGSLTPHLTYQQILPALYSKFTQNLITSQHKCIYYSIIKHCHFLIPWLQLVPLQFIPHP